MKFHSMQQCGSTDAGLVAAYFCSTKHDHVKCKVMLLEIRLGNGLVLLIFMLAAAGLQNSSQDI